MRKLGIWEVAKATVSRVAEANIELERHLEDWIAADAALLQEGLVVVGRQVQVESGPLDLLALDPQGRWVVIEIKRGALNRKAVAQVVDYAACLAELSADDLRSKLEPFLAANDLDLDELLEHREATDSLDPEKRELLLFIVGTGKAQGLERVIRFLAGRYGMPISVVLFDVFKLDDRTLLAREVTEQETSNQVIGTGLRRTPTVQSVLTLAEKYGTHDQLRKAVELAERIGLSIRPWKTSLMFAPQANRTRALFTLWVKPKKGDMKAYVGIEPFIEFFPVDRADVEKRLGAEGWRMLTQTDFEELLLGIEALDLGPQGSRVRDEEDA